ncbi:aliphatic sulfonate ABC transporter substrate-binding protein [Methanoregula sp.]|uniref:ABC transporter substrate-binding protein n=1 Tax=Methanoregula sp. TaxID=2052170 RepID=UPI002607E149|nr:aliphatic sulfonate ABC transporter substrate-binding protein [Methanoregula sp.]MDD5143515.1 aliphatic sulfonate ABC transporter substrate-binding protein [Methanoregula sp.]
MKSSALMAIAIIAVVLLLVTAGCTQPSGTTDTKTSKAPVDSLVIGYQPSTHQMAFITAMEKGWWQQDLAPVGVKKVSDKIFPSGPSEMQAMQAGDLDVAYVGAAPFLTAVSTGLDAKIVAGVNTQGSDLVVREGIEYTGPESLKGKTIGTFAIGSIQDTILRDWLKKNNVDPDKDLMIAPMSPGDAVTAILAGKVDAVFLPTPSPSTIVNQGKGKIVVHSGEMYPNHTCCVLVVSGKLIREHPEIVKQIIATNDKAVAWNLANKDEAAVIYANKTSARLDDVKASLAEWDGNWASDPNIIVEPVLDYAKIQYELRYIKKPLTKDDVFDLSFYQKS